ncbi:MAG: hypothetical protein KDK65_04055, partial [Chlamydiia bacterium]|nr:hypothetical protein [Chlamydiia bacterium]
IRPSKDKHEFTLAEHLQEKAQSVKNQGRKANIERITQMLQPLDSPRLHRGVEGEVVNVGGRQYRIAKTEGGGNCGLHAVLGTKQGDKYQAGATVRQEWIQKYQGNFEDVKDLYLADYIDLIGHGSQVEGRRLLEEPIKSKLEQIEANRKRKVEEKEKALDDAIKARLDTTVFGQLQYRPAGVNVLADLVDQNGDSAGILAEKRKQRANLLVKGNLDALGDGIKTLVQEKNQVNEASEAERKAYLLSDEAKNHYFAKLGGTSHYLTDTELQIVGKLYGQNVVTLTQQGDQVVQSDSTRTIDEDSVLVWKVPSGGVDHYCRLE